MQAHKERERRTSGSGEVLKETCARSFFSHVHTLTQHYRGLSHPNTCRRGGGVICTPHNKHGFVVVLVVNMGRYQWVWPSALYSPSANR